MDFFQKILRPKEVAHILETDKRTEGISIGELTEYEPQKLIALMNLWCERIDKVIALDSEVNGEKTWRSHQANQWRGFTYGEYAALFNKHITPNQFPFYPVFNQLRKHKGGINTEKQRTDILFHYELNESDYVAILHDQGFEKVLYFFCKGIQESKAFMCLQSLFSHVFLCAPTGWGKTVLMETLFFRMTKKFKKYSFVLLDPHGDISEKCKVHRHLKDRCIYIDPFLCNGYTPTFNPFDITDRSLKNITNTAEQIILALEEVLSKEGGDLTEIMTNMLEKCIYVLLKRPQSRLVDLVSLLSRDEQLFTIAAKTDSFFDAYFLKPNNKTREGLLNRINRLLNSPILSNLLGSYSTFNLEKVLNQNKVIIFNLSGLGEMSQIAFGKLIIASIKSIVKKRKKPSIKKHTFCFIDEAHNFVTGSYEVILSQLRGFGLHMVLANQYLEQFGDQAKSVKKNTSVKILGGGNENLEDIEKMIQVHKEMRLSKYEFYLKERYKEVVKFKSPSFLLKKKKKYYLSKKEEKQLNEYLISTYYKAIENSPIQQLEQVSNNSTTSKSPTPDLGLYIGSDD